MKDYLNRDVNIEDTVVVTEPRYRNFVTGKVIKITKCFCVVEYLKWDRPETCKFAHDFVIKILD